MDKISLLTTEKSNPKTHQIDEMSITEILNVMNEEDQTIALSVQRVLPQVEEVISKVVTAFQNEGRLFYVGAGTSGRIGILDAVECPPTFSTSPDLVQAILAGGEGAMFRAVEGAEDDEELGATDLKNLSLTSSDVVIGIAASGRTPYVIGALKYAGQCGATTVSLTSNLNSIISKYASIQIEVVTGPEILSGSTRLRAATAHKMILNMISTTSMIKTGKVYQNFMIDLNASNYKLKERAKKIVCTVTNVDYSTAEAVLEETEYNVKLAIVMILTNEKKAEAIKLISKSNGFVRQAINLSNNERG
ncbi:N-acetylmuramic acid 6-phosphate etherase [Ureibacillus manganicus]|uniref:N-acetylmuramic acid 6-phosphate etherase n=1 Tax=Ureibacillus manganicus DSM 26584 TaxID=1384049 RepID=A0A0A3I2J9_9BACL|nr:N-acetylmuramic acid 6-phosphate etherase [Ureibacillus manganicus]KGR77725.1 N-acetylmuramic acid-6-phosphate etherase [Ureibacillus manganicus DSM 26584]